MTIHKSKGLEFNVVIYPEAITDLDSKIGGNNAAAETWVAPEELGFEKFLISTKSCSRCRKMHRLKAKLQRKSVKKRKKATDWTIVICFTLPSPVPLKGSMFWQKPVPLRKTNVIEDYLKSHENKINRNLSIDDKRTIYQFGDPDFIHKAKNEDKSEKKQICESNTSDWFSKIQIDPTPSMFWISENDKMQPNEWGELVHEILSNIETSADIDKALLPYLSDGSIDEETANLLKYKFVQVTENPIVKEAFGPKAIVKTNVKSFPTAKSCVPTVLPNCPTAFSCSITRPEKRPQAPPATEELHFSLARHGFKQISAYLIYLGADVEVEEVVMDTLF